MLFEKPFAKIIGTGVYLPKRIVSNSELEKFLGSLESGWIEKRTGIKERRWCCEDEDMFSISVEAANMALKDAQIKDFDTLIIARSRFTDSRSFVNAGAVHEGLKSKGYKLDSLDYIDGFYACSGSLVALNEASLRIFSGQSRRSLVVSSSIGSKFISKSCPESSCLWGDGAAALVVETSENPGVLCYKGKGFSESWDAFSLKLDDDGKSYVDLNGKKIFRTVIEQVPNFVHGFVEEAGYSLNDISCFLFHQANERMNEKLCEKLGITSERNCTNVARFGNTSCASIPLAYHEVRGKLSKDDLCLMVGFGAAFHMNCLLYKV